MAFLFLIHSHRKVYTENWTSRNGLSWFSCGSSTKYQNYELLTTSDGSSYYVSFALWCGPMVYYLKVHVITTEQSLVLRTGVVFEEKLGLRFNGV